MRTLLRLAVYSGCVIAGMVLGTYAEQIATRLVPERRELTVDDLVEAGGLGDAGLDALADEAPRDVERIETTGDAGVE